jgi:ribonuclease R
VRLILERANPSLLAQVKQENEQFVAVPLDDRLKFTLNLLENGQNLQENIDYLVHVSVLRYPLGEMPPIGKVTVSRFHGQAAADTDIVSCKHDLPHNFPPEALEIADNLADFFDSGEKEQLRDLTQFFTFTIEDDNHLDYPPIIRKCLFFRENQPKSLASRHSYQRCNPLHRTGRIIG